MSLMVVLHVMLELLAEGWTLPLVQHLVLAVCRLGICGSCLLRTFGLRPVSLYAVGVTRPKGGC